MAFTPGWNRGRASNRVQFDVDLTAAAEATGAVLGIERTFRTKKYVSDVIDAVWREGAREFNTQMDAIALAAPKKFHHVYEWEMIGNPVGRLWKVNAVGHGATKNISFTFLPSKKAIPKSPHPKASDTPYRFGAKAAVMEFGIPVVIKPRTEGGRIFIPFREGRESEVQMGKGSWDWQNRGFVFADAALVTNPGGNVAGKFTAAWSTYWNTQGTTLFERKFESRISQAVRQITGVTRGKRGNSRTSFNLLVEQSAKQAMADLLAHGERLRQESMGGI